MGRILCPTHGEQPVFNISPDLLTGGDDAQLVTIEFDDGMTFEILLSPEFMARQSIGTRVLCDDFPDWMDGLHCICEKCALARFTTVKDFLS